ncbi:MAG: topoisomerase II [Caudoviricetes sp.]|nr:MAG: topoisomerase II [Caudoviricetes sp.]
MTKKTTKINNSEEFSELTPFQHVRQRVPVYFGSVVKELQNVLCFSDPDNIRIVTDAYVPAVFTCFREILDNSIDEVVSHGYGNTIKIGYNEKTSEFYVEDNGRGIPITTNASGEYIATVALSRLMAGRNFSNRQDSIGQNGIGASGVNFCSEYFHVRVRRDGQEFFQEFGEDLKNDILKINDPEIIPYNGKDTGTRIDFKLSKKVFKDLTLPEQFIKDRMVEIAAANPLIKFYFNDELIQTKNSFDKSILNKIKHITLNVFNRENKFKSSFYLVPYFNEDVGEHDESLVNNIPTFKGGPQVDTFKRLFYNGLLNFLTKESKKRKLTPNRSDMASGMLLLNVTNMQRPDFDSQSKSRLINSEASEEIKLFFDNEEIFKKIVKENPQYIENIYKKCEDRTKKKDASEINKLAKKVSKIKVPSLMDAAGKNRQQCALFITEGQSASGGVLAVRNPELHGVIPLRGKVLNVNGLPPKKVLENKILQDIMAALGLVIGKKAILSELNYGKVMIATDEDQDGKNIRSLMINFFYTFWPELFDDKISFINIFMTPFIIAQKAKERKYWYSYNYDEFNSEKLKGWNITRAKGLGTLIEEDWKYALDNPVTQSIVDDGNLKEALDLIFGPDADLRKDWMGINGN